MRLVNPPGRYIDDIARNTIAYVLAGGKGTRLGSLTKVRAKPATPFGGKYRIIDFTLSNCMNSGIRRVGVMTQYNAIGLLQHVQRTWSHLVSEMGEFVYLLPAHQGSSNGWYTGTADAIWQNLKMLEVTDTEHVLVLAGDHVYSMDYLTMLHDHVAQNADVTIGCVEVPQRVGNQFGILQCDEDGRIHQFIEKPDDPSPYALPSGNVLASMGIYVFNKQMLLDLLHADHQDENSSHDFGNDILPKALASHKLIAHHFKNCDGQPGYWRDVGTIEAYYDASMDLIAAVPKLNLYNKHWPIWTYQEHLPPVKLTHDSCGHHAYAKDSLISAGCVFVGAQISRSLCCYNVRVEACAEVHQSILLPDVHVGANCVVHHAIIDEGCVIPDGLEIGEDAELDAQRFAITENGVVVVTKAHLAQLV